MFNGTKLWEPFVELHMETREFGGRKYETYKDLPDNIYQAAKTTAEKYPENICIVDDDGTRITYKELIALTDQFAEYLKKAKEIKHGDHVAMILNSSREFVIAYLAIIKIGAVAMPLPSKYREQEIFSLLEKSDAVLVICEPKYAAWIEEHRQSYDVLVSHSGANVYGFEDYRMKESCPDDLCEALPEKPAVMLFTSGTTSKSKGVVLSNFNVMHAAITYKTLMQMTPEDSTLIPAPIYQVTSLFAQLSAFLSTGGTVYLHHTFQAERVLKTLQDEKITYLHSAPTIFSLLLEEKNGFPEFPVLRALVSGGSFMAAKKIKAVHEWIPNASFRSVYGMTETASPATLMPYETATCKEISSAGLPVPGLLSRVVDDQGNEMPVGKLGEVQFKGTNILIEYYQMNTPLLTEEGWLSTGDIGYFDENGFLYLVDRKKDMINRGGEKICSYDVENELYRIQDIEEASVVGIPDDLYGEVPVAAVVLREGSALTEEEIHEDLKTRLAKYQIPVRFLFLDKLPVTPNGKVSKVKIRELF